MDNYQAKNERLREENIQLIIANYRLHLKNAYHEGGCPGMIDEACKINEQQIRAIYEFESELAEVRSFIVNAFEGALKQQTQFAAELNKEIDEIAEVNNERRIPEIVGHLIWASDSVQRDTLQLYESSSTRQEIESRNSTLNPKDDYQLIIKATHWRVWMAGIQKMCLAALRHARALSNDPRDVCDQIVRECWNDGYPQMRTLQWLPMDWYEENLPDPPRTYQMLQEGLRIIQEEKKATDANGRKPTRSQFANKKSMNPRTIQIYQGWWKAIEKRSLIERGLVQATRSNQNQGEKI